MEADVVHANVVSIDMSVEVAELSFRRDLAVRRIGLDRQHRSAVSCTRAESTNPRIGERIAHNVLALFPLNGKARAHIKLLVVQHRAVGEVHIVVDEHQTAVNRMNESLRVVEVLGDRQLVLIVGSLARRLNGCASARR